MGRLLALEWNDTEARAAVASLRGDRVTIEQAFSVDLRADSPGEDEANVDVGQRISAALAARGLGRLDSLVAVGRASIELRRMSLPPAPEEELPNLVRFQALREFTTIEDTWPLDFLPLKDASEQSLSVLAAAIDPELVGQIQNTCRTAGLKPRQLTLRPCSAASLLRRFQKAGPAEVRLLVDLLVDEADLTVIVDGDVIFLRTARLSGDPLGDSATGQSLFSEIRRTIAAAQNQLGGRPVESIVLCGAGGRHEDLAKAIREELSLPTELFDPFGELRLAPELRRALPEEPGRFAPLLGALLDELQQTPHAIDFLNPRRPPKPASRRNTYSLASLAAAVVVLGLFWYGWYQGRQTDAEIRKLGIQSKRLQAEIEEASKDKRIVDAIENWSAADVIWLDELHWLSETFPAADQAMITQLKLMAGFGGAVMDMDGVAHDVQTLKAMEDRLSDASHDLVGRDKSAADLENPYTLRFTSSLYVNPEQD